MLSEEQILQAAADEMNASIAREFSLQGHTLTGTAERSLIAEVKRVGTSVVATGTAVEYMKTLDEGLEPGEITLNAAYVDELARYVELRMGIRGRAALRVAYLIAKKHKQEGMPTESSKQYSQTGERKGFLKDADERPENRTTQIIDNGIDQMMDAVFSKQKNETV